MLSNAPWSALRRIITPQREVLNRLARDDFEVVDSKDRIFFRDIYDHLVRLHDLTESMRDLLSGTMDAYLSVINNRMNEVMKILAIITTLFMPISFVTGFFGMNFFAPGRPDPGKMDGVHRLHRCHADHCRHSPGNVHLDAPPNLDIKSSLREFPPKQGREFRLLKIHKFALDIEQLFVYYVIINSTNERVMIYSRKGSGAHL